MNKLLLSLVSLIITTQSASAAIKPVNTSGNDIFWLLITIGLTLFFALKGMEMGLLRNPIVLIAFIILIIIIYIISQAVLMVLGIGDIIDNSIQHTANTLTNLTELI